MRPFAACFMLACIVAIASGFQEKEQAPEPVGKAQPEAKEVKGIITDELIARRLIIVDNKGKQVATLTSAGNGAGLWLQHPTGPMIAIFTIEGQAGIGFYESSRPDNGGMPLALTLDRQNGKPVIQVRDWKKKGEPKWIDLLELAK